MGAVEVIKRMVCLANSRRPPNGRCVAGRELLDRGPGPWIRPVSGGSAEAVSESERSYGDGSEPRVLDVIDVPVVEARPGPNQPENWVLDAAQRWERIGTYPVDQVDDLVEHPEELWTNEHSTYHGLHDSVDPADVTDTASSLRLIAPDEELAIHVLDTVDYYGNGRLRVQGRFLREGIPYWLWITDPIVEEPYLAAGEGVYEYDPCLLTISLSQEFHGYCFKLIAAVIGRQ